MSDPVSNAEIEDVLSSIRRLISDSSASSDRENDKKVERLVLTPAFRVHDDDAATPVKSAPEVEPEQDETATDDSVETVEGDTTPVFSHRGYDRQQVEDAEELPLVNDGTAETSDDPVSEQMVDYDAPISSRFGGWEPDEGEETTPSDVLKFHADRLNLDTEDNDQSVRKTAKSASVPEAPYAEVDHDDDLYDAAVVLTPSDQSASNLRNLPSKTVEIVGEDTDIIDEEVVQAMVARLVREELQGEVGEKITQSIRRFVRREIERAITLKGLE